MEPHIFPFPHFLEIGRSHFSFKTCVHSLEITRFLREAVSDLSCFKKKRVTDEDKMWAVICFEKSSKCNNKLLTTKVT